ncbi:hypothetical protein SNOG_09218 [Parastagonospora nodorum SN15]|uniref:Uncharacterized protein n=2 Tax=Phaeosphaeria nodorum (strain SN15 / ATCC MYA-4574 / FGSC 10173) TaxID=321614 RepID=A0A7U2F931_PHANO|nr:hypothetical protein SNOG_09218 [Parastagonospora nodorum SN15]EAT83410.1 hypothetical protein SNOG_09218 [Parastagonospora nodorum SN15]QRD00673.1 hypothetical protein JI435_092180 [Parastagonospora nodorum SN15]
MHRLDDLWNGTQKAKQGCIVFLNGFPGVGKLTIAQIMMHNLAAETTRLIDNHVLIDPAEAIVPGRNPAHKALRREIRRVAFEALTKEMVSHPNVKVIMTGCLADNSEDIAVLAEHVRIAQDTDGPFYLVEVTCDRAEHGRRLEAPARATGGKTKLQDGSILQALLQQNRLVKVRNLPTELLRAVDISFFELDTTDLNVDQTVAKTMRRAC